MIAGRTLLARVIDLGREAVAGQDAELTVATDDARVAAHAEDLGCPSIMTSAAIATGSGRALAAALSRPTPPDVVCCLQGDAPFMPVQAVRLVLRRIAKADCDCATPIMRLDWPTLDALREHKRMSPSSGTTCVRTADGRALWFSKSVLPQMRDEVNLRQTSQLSPVYQHLGLYAYTLEALKRMEEASPSPNERLEGLEQLRLLELGMTIQTVEVAGGPLAMGGIDTAADVQRAERLIAEAFDRSSVTSFYIVRHGNTFGPEDTPVRIGCRTDLPLTDTGERQAEAIGRWFAAHGIAFGHAFAGSLSRTRRTAELILASQHPAPLVVPAEWLTELDYGVDEGKTDDLVSARVGEAALRSWDRHGVAPPGWDVASEARLAAWRRLFATQWDDSVLLVTSNGAARFALLAGSGPRPSSLKLRTAAFGRIVASQNGELIVTDWDVRP